jgi:NAD(P)-dependent dehydrogenase (short-subunit alcohol dehydrogenase family)
MSGQDSGVRDRTGALLADKVAVITGAGSGVGRATARLFAAQGAAVVCGDLRQAWVDETATLITDAGGRAVGVTCDVMSEGDVQDLVAVARSTYGRIDVLHNNAGISTPGMSIGDHTDADWDRIVNVNLRGAFYGSKVAVAAFTEQGGGGVIVNTSSVSGLVGFGGVVYGITKGGMNQMTKALAIEVGPLGIRVNAICPGPMLTNLTRAEHEAFVAPTQEELTRFGSMNPTGVPVYPEDVADAALFLASDMSAAITGVLLPVDQGFTCR